MPTIDLPELVKLDLGAPSKDKGSAGGMWWLCPFHEESTPSFQVSLYDRRQKWRYKCWACDQQGDAFDWLVTYRQLSNTAAWQLLHGAGAPVPREIQERPAPITYAQPPVAEWQGIALELVLECASNLAGDNEQAAAARQYLLDRGLRPATIERALLGWNPYWREVMPGCLLPPGITIPCFTAETLWYVKVRLTRKEERKRGDKYLALTGSRTASLYNAEALLNARAAVATEGEFDALLLSQFFASDELATVTMGSATNSPSPRWKAYFAWLDKLLVVMDKDAAGNQAADRWRDVVQWVQTVEPPDAAGKDITDWWQAGVDLRDWLGPYIAEPSPEQALVQAIFAATQPIDPTNTRQPQLPLELAISQTAGAYA